MNDIGGIVKECKMKVALKEHQYEPRTDGFDILSYCKDYCNDSDKISCPALDHQYPLHEMLETEASHVVLYDLQRNDYHFMQRCPKWNK